MSHEYVFYSPRPAELGTINEDAFDAMTLVGHELGSKYSEPDSYILSPQSIGCEIASDGTASVITDRIYKDVDDVTNVTAPLTTLESELLLETLKPFVTASKDWLHPNETVILSFFRSQQLANGPGGWHADGTPGSDDFRGALFYDKLPTEFLEGRIRFDIPDDHYPPTPRRLGALISPSTITKALMAETTELALTRSPKPFSAVGISNNSLHRVAPIPQALDGTVRTFLRLVTRSSQ
jgi:hypothetical protein